MTRWPSRRLVEWLGGRSKRLLVALSVLTILVVGILDTILPRQLSLAIFHVVPVFVTAWFVGRSAGAILACLSSIVWFVSDELSAFAPPTLALELWDLGVKSCFFVVIVLLIRRLKEVSDREATLARNDEVTGVANRRGFLEIAGRELERAHRYSRPLSAAYIDVDDFKSVNDRSGHYAGDDLLRGVAETLQRSVRSIDIVGRLGGDEFVLLFPETDLTAVEAVVKKVERNLAGLFRESGHLVSASIGVVGFRDPPRSVDELLRCADALMYEVKSSGKGAVRFRESGSSAPAK